MSHTRYPCTTSRIKNNLVDVGRRIDNGKDGSANKKKVSDRSSSPDSVRERALKQVGLTSTTFIGPAFPPSKSTPPKKSTPLKKNTKVKVDIEDTLSEFYKELEKIDEPDCAYGIQPPIPIKTSTSKQTRKVSEEKGVYMSSHAGTEDYQKNSGQKESSWSHWYQNEPYHPRRQGPGAPAQNQWHHPQTLNGPPNPRFHRPPFQRPPPPTAFPNQQNPPSTANPNWSASGPTNPHQEQPHFPTFSPQNVSSHPSQGFYGESSHHLDRDERVCSYDVHSDNVKFGWSNRREEDLCHFVEDYGRSQRYDFENEPWDHDYRPPATTNAFQTSLVLILMRGLPGSGKSTLAREKLSSNPNGLILSTDDYFACRDGYRYDPGLLGAAHEWNLNRAKDAMHDVRSPIIIDNTNVQAWEMKPYVEMALEKGYKVDFCEPDTSWKFDPYELERRNKHSVPQEKIAQMMDRFSFPISVDIVMRSQEPAHVTQRPRPEQPHMMRKNQDFF